MPVQNKPIIHGRDHEPDGADPMRIRSAGQFTSYRDMIEAAGPWAYWPLDDSSGDFADVIAGRDLTAVDFTSGPPNYTFAYGEPGPFTEDPATSTGFLGIDSNIAPFAGTSAVRELAAGDYTELFEGDTTFAFEIWAYPTTPTEGGSPDLYGYLAMVGNAGSTNLWALYIDATGDLHASGNTGTLAGPSVTVNGWNHVALTYDGTTTSLYLNGTLVDSDTGGIIGSPTTLDIQLGRQTTVGFQSKYFEGRLAHAVLYANTLTADTVAAHAGGVGGGGGGFGTASTDKVLHADGTGGTHWDYVDTPSIADEAVTPPKIQPGSDGQVLTTSSGAAWAAPPTPADDILVWMPLTTVTGGVPELVWDAGDDLIPTLTPI